MAASMASAVARNIPPPYAVPVGPRIRPPRLLPGTKAANTDPQPDEPPPEIGYVWVQGKWRNPLSKAAKDRRELESTRTEKALRHAAHGMNIYAYSNIRTNQVVYSLTRVMQNNKILPQLVFHGKQTVPSSLRRDMWRPYFSIHFPQTPAGAEAGLIAYRRLREFAVQRQLSPPRGLLVAKSADAIKSRNHLDPYTYRETKKAGRLKNMAVKNQLLPKKLRAKKLMDQKATSVADAARVLQLVNDQLSPAQHLDAINELRSLKHENWSSRALRRLQEIRDSEAEKDTQIEARQQRTGPKQGDLGLTPHAARRIAAEYGGKIASPVKGAEFMVNDLRTVEEIEEVSRQYESLTESGNAAKGWGQRPTTFDVKEFRSEFSRMWKEKNGNTAEEPSAEEIANVISQEKAKVTARIEDYKKQLKTSQQSTETGNTDPESRDNASRTVQVLWADIRDAVWAERWSSNVFHGELEQRHAMHREKTITSQNVTIDETGNQIPAESKHVTVQNSSTPHVFGSYMASGSYQTPEQMSTKRQQWRDVELGKWQEQKLDRSREILHKMMALRRRKATQELEVIKKEFPSLYDRFSDFQVWRDGLDVYTNLLKFQRELRDMKTAYDEGETEVSGKLQNIDRVLSSYAQKLDESGGPAYEALGSLTSESSNAITLEKDLLNSTTKSRQRITQFETRVHELEQALLKDTSSDTSSSSLSSNGKTQKSLLDARSALDNEHNLIISRREEIWSHRAHAIDDALSEISSSPSYQDTGVIDLLQQRLHAEETENTDQLAALDVEMNEKEDIRLAELLGMTTRYEANIVEVSGGSSNSGSGSGDVSSSGKAQDMERARERGIEMPAPPRKGLWSRLMGMFGR